MIISSTKPKKLKAAIIFIFFTVLSILPLLFVHESRALRFVGNRMFFVYSAVSTMPMRHAVCQMVGADQQMLGTLLVCLAWLFSIYGWSIAHRAFEVDGTDVELGPAVSRNSIPR